ncbi:hypothetical protein [Caulobacter sp. BP25]|uniref:TRAFAC clade GTPase domain-containing protein n=1 Tax=Caulobacter sp. BP25 TaxID=2048900 RepID=UPI002100AFE3|nr:hypothetical protein [Caulobacter sp. BP25]
MSEVAERRCRQPGCGGPASGVCIENLSFDECPNLVLAGLDDSGSEQGAISNESQTPEAGLHQDLVRTGNAANLDVRGCDALLRARSGIVIAVVAAPEVGKTTLLATLYELVHRGMLPGFGFAGSETLRGFEERCFLSRTKSERFQPDTPRTPARAELTFTHIRIARPGAVYDLVMADRSGEHFQRVLNTPGAITSFEELSRADVIILLVDGEQLVKSPHRPRSDARRLFMSLQQANLVRNRPILLVATKRDLVAENDITRLEEELADLQADLDQREPGLNLQSMATGARARLGGEFGEGFDKLVAALFPVKSSGTFTLQVPSYDGTDTLEELNRPLRSRIS